MTQKNLLQSAADGTAIPAGYIGEVRSLETSTSTSASSVLGNQLSLTPGIWLLSGQATIQGTGPTKAMLNLEAVSGATVLGHYALQSYAGGDGGTIARLNCGGMTVSVASSANVRCNLQQTVSATAQVNLTIQAIRIA